jgi:hypothetical protein
MIMRFSPAVAHPAMEYIISRGGDRVRTRLCSVAMVLRLLQEVTQAMHNFLELIRLVRANLTRRKDVTGFRCNDPPPPMNSRQLALNWAIT